MKRTLTALVLSALLAAACGAGATTETTAHRASQIEAMTAPAASSLSSVLIGAAAVETREARERFARVLLADRLRIAEEARVAGELAEAERIAAVAAEEARVRAEAAAEAEEAARTARAASARLVVASRPPVTVPVRVTPTTVYEPPSPQSRTVRQGNTPPDYVLQCESGGNYGAINPNGHYGAWQFSRATWNGTARSAGRSDLVGVRPDRASPADQDAMAAALYDGGRGASHWECA